MILNWLSHTVGTSVKNNGHTAVGAWVKIWGELQKKFFLRHRVGFDPEGAKTGPLAFIWREMAPPCDTPLLYYREAGCHKGRGRGRNCVRVGGGDGLIEGSVVGGRR